MCRKDSYRPAVSLGQKFHQHHQGTFKMSFGMASTMQDSGVGREEKYPTANANFSCVTCGSYLSL